MEKSFRLLVLAALIALGWLGWRLFFPGPARVIRSRLNGLARTASFEKSDGIVPKGFKMERIPDYFTPDVVVNLEARGLPHRSFSGRQDLQEAVGLAMQAYHGVKVEFLDIVVTVGPDQQTATADLTARVTIADEKDFYVAELNFLLKKVQGAWLIYRVESVGPDTPRPGAALRHGSLLVKADSLTDRQPAWHSGL